MAVVRTCGWGRARTVGDVCDGVEEFGDVGRDEVVLGFNFSFSQVKGAGNEAGSMEIIPLRRNWMGRFVSWVLCCV